MQKYRKKTKLLAISTENITFALNIADDQMQRVNWIDWAKTMAVCSVVFCHLPQSQEWFYYRYLQAVTITIFFFISGFLKKDHGNHQANWKKYWHGLILPYMLYNAIVYPYWLLRYYLQYHGMPDATEALKPIIGTLLFEHQGPFAEPLNGSLWYLPAILFMHIIIDLCHLIFPVCGQQTVGVHAQSYTNGHLSPPTLLLFRLCDRTETTLSKHPSEKRSNRSWHRPHYKYSLV
jgi:hypothetical protein